MENHRTARLHLNQLGRNNRVRFLWMFSFRLRYLLSGSTCWVHSRETFRCSLLHNSGSPNGRIKSRTFLGIGNVYHRAARKRLIRLLESVRVLIEGGSRNRDEIVLFLLLEASVLM